MNEKTERYKGIMPAGDDKKPKGSYLFDQKISDSKGQPSLYIQIRRR